MITDALTTACRLLGRHLLYPHVNMTAEGASAMIFGLGGPGTYLCPAYATVRPGRDYGPIQLAAAELRLT
ncbi:MAG: hypothetical protein ABI112_01220 [Terracoccus sp.]